MDKLDFPCRYPEAQRQPTSSKISLLPPLLLVLLLTPLLFSFARQVWSPLLSRASPPPTFPKGSTVGAQRALVLFVWEVGPFEFYNLETFSRVSKARLRHYMRPSCSIDLAREISAICRALISMAIGAARAWSRCVFVVVHYICAFCICQITHFLLFEAYWACLCAILFSGREDGHMHE